MRNRWQWALAVVIGLPLISLLLFILAQPDLATAWQYTPWIFVSKVCAIIGASLFAINFVLSSRSPLVEKFFGGLDNVYRLHRWTGYTAWIFLLEHAVFMMIGVWNFPTLRDMILIPGRYWPYNLGVLALGVMDIIIIATIIKQIPYRWWRATHSFMSVALLLALGHVALVPSDVQRNLPLRIWMLSLFTIAVISYLYRKVWYPYFGPQYQYTVTALKTKGAIIDLELTPQGTPLRFHPGQFVFIDFPNNAFIPGEDHPFSIASHPLDSRIRLGIKQVGDYTKLLPKITTGQAVTLRGPFGHFGDKLLTTTKDAIWIAGGIGVTPFLSMLEWELRNKDSTRTIHFFYTCTTPQEAVFHEEIQQKTKSEMSRIIYSPWYSTHQGRLTAEQILKQVGTFKKKRIFLCGPNAMMYDLAAQLTKLGVRNTQIIFEDFSFK